MIAGRTFKFYALFATFRKNMALSGAIRNES